MILTLILLSVIAGPTYWRLRRIKISDSAPHWHSKMMKAIDPKIFMALAIAAKQYSEAINKMAESFRQLGKVGMTTVQAVENLQRNTGARRG